MQMRQKSQPASERKSEVASSQNGYCYDYDYDYSYDYDCDYDYDYDYYYYYDYYSKIGALISSN